MSEIHEDGSRKKERILQMDIVSLFYEYPGFSGRHIIAHTHYRSW